MNKPTFSILPFFLGSIFYSLCLSALLNGKLLANENEQKVELISFHYPPFINSKDSESFGVLMDLGLEILSEANIEHDKRLVPYARMKHMIDNKETAIYLAPMEVIEHNETENYLLLPFFRYSMHAYILEKNRTKLLNSQGNLNKEKTFSTAFLRESADEFRVLETYQINEWISSNSLEQLVNMLLKGRVDFIQGVPLSIYHEVKALNISNNSIVQTREPTYSGLAGFIIDKNKFTTNQISKLVISRNKLLTSTKMIPVYEKFNFKQADLTNEI